MSTGGEVSGSGPRYYSEPRTHKRHAEDFYIEPAWTVEALLAAEMIPGPAWDPCCGSGTIPKVLKAAGIYVIATDVADRGHGGRQDFLIEPPPRAFGEIRSIVANPPYGLAQAFIERALGIATEKVAMLLQSKFPYSQRRHALFTKHPPARIYFLSDRPSMPPGEKLLAGLLEAKGGKLDYLWMVWDRAHEGPTTARWLRRASAAAPSNFTAEPPAMVTT